jgi:hypothetical protein
LSARLTEKCPAISGDYKKESGNVRRRALAPHTFAMTGKSDLTGQAEAGLAALYGELNSLVDRAVEALKTITLKGAGALEIQRFVRAVELTARAGRATALLSRPLGRGGRGAAGQAEDDMADDDFDDSPEALERIRDGLEQRLGELDRTFERKGLAFRPGRWPAARAGGEPAGAAAAPDPGH